MGIENKSLGEIEVMLSDILSRCDLDAFLNVETIRMWMTELEENEYMSHITMVGGLLDDDTKVDIELINELLEAMLRLRHLTPSRSFGGTMAEELEKKRKSKEPIVIHLDQVEFPPSEWWLDYEDAMECMRQRRFTDAAERFEETFATLLESRTTWREIYRLYCNAGLGHLFSGNEILGVQCLDMACKLNPNYTFAHEQLKNYQEGEFAPYIKLGVLRRVKDGFEEWLERPDHLNLNKVMGWPKSRIIKKLSKFGVKVDKDRFCELAKNVYSPDDIASKLFHPQTKINGKDEDYIRNAAYALWDIYCPNEPSVTILNDAIEKAVEFISNNLNKDIGSSRIFEARCSEHLNRILKIILSGKEGFLGYWSKTYEYDTINRYNLKYFLTSLASLSAFEKPVLDIVGSLKDQIPHPDWNGIEIGIHIHKGDPLWKTTYNELMTKYPFNCYTASDVAAVFEEINDLENTERYLIEALQIVDGRAVKEMLSLETTRTTIYDDYDFILDRLRDFYERTKADDTKLGTIKAKRKEVEDRSDIYSVSPEMERLHEALSETIVGVEAERASTSCSLRYYDYLKQYKINFATEEEVQTDLSQIKIQAKDYEITDPNKSKKSSPGSKKRGKKIGRNSPCPCGSGKKYKKCCLKIDL